MRVFIISTRNMGRELQGGLVGVVGSARPSAQEKRDCIEEVSRLIAEGWAIAADPHSTIGWLAALSAEAACVPFVALRALDDSEQHGVVPAPVADPVRGLE